METLSSIFLYPLINTTGELHPPYPPAPRIAIQKCYILYTTMSENSMNEDNGKLIREIQTKIEELQKYKIDVIDKFKEKFSEKNQPDTHTYYQYLNYEVSAELKKIKRQFYDYDDNREDDGNYLKFSEKNDNITGKGINIFYIYSDLYNDSLKSLSMLETELINRITNPHLKIQYENI